MTVRSIRAHKKIDCTHFDLLGAKHVSLSFCRSGRYLVANRVNFTRTNQYGPQGGKRSITNDFIEETKP
jgi:hypothetical protein